MLPSSLGLLSDSCACLPPDVTHTRLPTPTAPGSTGHKTSIHERLYKNGLERKQQQLSEQTALLHHKIQNVPFKSYENLNNTCNSSKSFSEKDKGRTHLAKKTLADTMSELLLPVPTLKGGFDGDLQTLTEEDEEAIHMYNMHYTPVEFDESLQNLWNDLTTMS